MQAREIDQVGQDIKTGYVESQDGEPVLGKLIEAGVLGIGQKGVCPFAAEVFVVTGLKALDYGIPGRVCLGKRLLKGLEQFFAALRSAEHEVENLTGGAASRIAALTPPGMQARIDLTMTDEYPYAYAQVIISAVPA